MKAKTAILGVLALSMLTIGPQGCGERGNINTDDTGGRATVANVNASTTVQTAAIESELIQIERDLRTAAKTRDRQIFDQLLADDIVAIGPEGTVVSKAEIMRNIDSKAVASEKWEIGDLTVRVLSADSAIVTGYAFLTDANYRKKNGKEIAQMRGTYRFTHVFERRGGRWQIVHSQTTKVEDPQKLK